MNKYMLFINHLYDLLKNGYSVIDALMIVYSISELFCAPLASYLYSLLFILHQIQLHLCAFCC